MEVPVSFLIIFLLIILVRQFTVLFHELGHGIPALLMTKDKVKLYIGSHGDPYHLTFQLGRLEFFFKYNPLIFGSGLCVFENKELSINRQIFITVLGPLTSLILGALCCYIAFAADLYGTIKLISIIIFGSSLYDFFINLVPKNEPILHYDGLKVYNDGQQLKKLFKLNKVYSQYTIGADHFNNHEYEKAAKAYHDIIDSGIKSDFFYRLAIIAYSKYKNYEVAFSLHNEFEKHCELNSDDYANSGFLKSQLGNYNDALPDYEKSLNINPQNRSTLNNRGYAYHVLEQFDKAVADFDKAIEIDPEFTHSYNNRGLSKLRLGKEAEGLKDIETSLELDSNNAYAYRNLGIFNFEKGNYKKALELFQKALELDKDTLLVTDYIEETEEILKRPVTHYDYEKGQE